MIHFTKKLLTSVCLVLATAGAQQAFAQSDDGTVNTVLTPHSKDGIFSSTASYTFDVTSTYKKPEVGRVSYRVLTETGKMVKQDSVHVKISGGGTGSYNFEIPGLKPGFYKINFMVNVSDYDDTTRKAFGIKPKELTSQFGKPADFESFWHNAMLELGKVKPEYKVTELPDSSDATRKVFEVEMHSLDGLVIRGFLTEPVTKEKSKKFAVLLALPGYQVTLGPMLGTDPDIAIFTLNIRGNGYSRDVINVRRENYILLNIEDKNKYVLKGAVMDCVRAVDFIYSR